MNAGKFSHIIEFYSQTTASDGVGGFTSTWSLYHTDWCSIKELTGKRAYEFEAVTGFSGFEIVMNYHPQITAPNNKMKIVIDSKDIIIHSVNNVEFENWFWVIIAYWKQNA